MDEQALEAIVARRWRLATLLTAIMTIVYFGFILMVAFAKPTAGEMILDDRVSVGVVVGAIVILIAPLLTIIYVRWANHHYDSAIHGSKQ